MSLITLYLVLKYLVDIRPLTPLTLTKTSKKRRFSSLFFQRRPLSGQYRPDGWLDGIFFYFKTYRIKFRIDPYTIDAYPICQFLTLRGQAHIHTDRQTNIVILLII